MISQTALRVPGLLCSSMHPSYGAYVLLLRRLIAGYWPTTNIRPWDDICQDTVVFPHRSYSSCPRLPRNEEISEALAPTSSYPSDYGR